MKKGSLGRPGWWLFVAILIGIWQSQPEISAAIKEGGLDYTIYLGPMWVKAVKDVYMLLLWLYLVLLVKDPFPNVVRNWVTSFYVITTLAFFWACFQLSPLMAAAGLRWILGAFVIIELRRFYGVPLNVKLIVKLLFMVLIAQVILQSVRLFYFPPIWGEVFGVVARVPGFFLLPNTNAMFVTSIAAMIIDMLGRQHKLSRISLLLAIMSVGLSQSGGGFAACAVLLAFVYLRNPLLALPFLIFFAVMFLNVSPVLLGREDFLLNSGGERIDKLYLALKEFAGVGAFGLYTNTGFMLAISDVITGNSSQEPVISDSFYVSIIGNFGMFCVIVVFAFWKIFSISSQFLRHRGCQLGIASMLCLGTFAFSTNVIEVFPMTVMLGVTIWVGSKHKQLMHARPIRFRKSGVISA